MRPFGSPRPIRQVGSMCVAKLVEVFRMVWDKLYLLNIVKMTSFPVPDNFRFISGIIKMEFCKYADISFINTAYNPQNQMLTTTFYRNDVHWVMLRLLVNACRRLCDAFELRAVHSQPHGVYNEDWLSTCWCCECVTFGNTRYFFSRGFSRIRFLPPDFWHGISNYMALEYCRLSKYSSNIPRRFINHRCRSCKLKHLHDYLHTYMIVIKVLNVQSSALLVFCAKPSLSIYDVICEKSV